MLRLQYSRQDKSAHSIADLSRFRYVREWNDEFLECFPHREDYLWAEHPVAGERPQWHTESNHPLSDRQIKQGHYLFGVRFGPLTNYLMLDIDPGSSYFPARDPFAITNLLNALEPLGLVAYVAVRSSQRGGLHLYLPFQESQKSWAIARAAATLLTAQGFKLAPGQLELFPNPKPYSQTPTLYNGHRLPLQPGSYLLNQEWEPIYSTQTEFIRRWTFAQTRNDVSHKTVEKTLKEAQHKAYRTLRNGGKKYLNDLNAEIEPGWTAPGQTNFLLGKIANRERVFHHVLWGGEPLEGAELAQVIAQVARSLPGFEEFCGHQAELEHKARAWARAAEQRYYPYPYGSVQSQPSAVGKTDRAELSWNEKQAHDARERIRNAIADLLNQKALPAQATARRNAIRAYGIGNKTLDKNRDLWHPEYLKPLAAEEYHPIAPSAQVGKGLESLPAAAYHPICSNKLEGLASSDALSSQSEASRSDPEGGCGGFSTGSSSGPASEEISAQETEPKGIEWVKLVLLKIQARKQQTKLANSKHAESLPDEYYSSSPSLHCNIPEKSHLTPTRTVVADEQNKHNERKLENRSHTTLHKMSKQSYGAETPERSTSVATQFSSVSSCLTEVENLSDTIAAIQVQIKRLQWTPEQARQYIAKNFKAKTREKLSGDELTQLLEQLKRFGMQI